VPGLVLLLPLLLPLLRWQPAIRKRHSLRDLAGDARELARLVKFKILLKIPKRLHKTFSL
jgi:hypothetical protein